MQPTNLVTMLREASNVRRCHTLPHHGEYTVGKHSYDAVMLLFALHPNPSMNLVKAVLVHDLGERWCGDIPAPAKWSDGELAKRLDQLETRCIRSLGFDMDLTSEERIWLNAVDKVELLLWAKDQLALGNMNASVVVGNLLSYFAHSNLPQPVQEFLANHTWTRTPDQLPK